MPGQALAKTERKPAPLIAPAPQESSITAVPVRRLSLNLSEPTYNELIRLAKERRSSMTEIVRLALGLVKIAITEAQKGNKLIVTTADGLPEKEIVLP